MSQRRASETPKFKIGGQSLNIGEALGFQNIRTIQSLFGDKYTPQQIISAAQKQNFEIKGPVLRKYTDKPVDTQNVFPSRSAQDLATINAQRPSVWAAGTSELPYDDPSKYNQDSYQTIGLSPATAESLNASKILADLQFNYQKELDSLKYASEYKMQEKDLASKELLKNLEITGLKDIEGIKGQNDINLQNIVNAGLKEVEGIRVGGAKDVARITGEFGVEEEKVRQAGQKDLFKIQTGSNVYGNLVSAFSF